MEQENKKIDKLTDKAFSRLVVTSIIGIFMCIVCLCSTTFAWFKDDAPSEGNRIQMADECLLAVTVSKDGTPIEGIENGVALEAGVYDVTLSLPGNTASGYCLITAGGVNYHTDYIVRHTEDMKEISFKLVVDTAQTVVFTPRWGIFTGESDIVESDPPELRIP